MSKIITDSVLINGVKYQVLKNENGEILNAWDIQKLLDSLYSFYGLDNAQQIINNLNNAVIPVEYGKLKAVR